MQERMRCGGLCASILWHLKYFELALQEEDSFLIESETSHDLEISKPLLWNSQVRKRITEEYYC